MPVAALVNWSPPADWLRVTTLDAHTAGEPLRIVTGGFPALEGDTILAKRRTLGERFDHLRRFLMWEPRGHADMYGCVITPPVTPGADFGVLFLHNAGYSTMCGHGIIAVVTVAVQTGLVRLLRPDQPIRIDTPAGTVTAYAVLDEGRLAGVRFHNVPSYVAGLDLVVAVAGLGDVRYDLAFGGAFYAFVDAASVGLRCSTDNYQRLISAGRAIKQAVAATAPPEHPEDPELGFLYGTVFTGPPHAEGADVRNVCVFADGEVDRSPTGTSVSAQLALARARGQLSAGGALVFESILGTRFSGRIVGETHVGPHPAVVPEIGGSAFVTGRHEFLLDPADTIGHGFLLR